MDNDTPEEIDMTDDTPNDPRYDNFKADLTQYAAMVMGHSTGVYTRQQVETQSTKILTSYMDALSPDFGD